MLAINQEKADFRKAVMQDGRLDALKSVAANDCIFAVNEAVNNKMMYYAACHDGGLGTRSNPRD